MKSVCNDVSETCIVEGRKWNALECRGTGWHCQRAEQLKLLTDRESRSHRNVQIKPDL